MPLNEYSTNTLALYQPNEAVGMRIHTNKHGFPPEDGPDTVPFRPAILQKAREITHGCKLTYEEKAMIAFAAAKAGFKGLADFIRTTVLDRTLFSR